MREVRLAPEAMGDLADIRRYTIKRWGADRARAYLGGLGILFKQIANGVARTRPADEIRLGYRRIRYRSHVVFLVEDDASIRVMRVLHARMHFEARL
jgi:toxin ParE1/3/4